MLNNVVLVGRLVRDIELKKTQSNATVTRFTLAVNRDNKNSKGEYDTDFINCVAWGNSAEYLGKYANKGDLIDVKGRIQTGSYTKNNETIYTFDVLCDTVHLLSKANKKEGYTGTVTKEDVKKEHEFKPIEFEQEDLPFYGG